MQRRELIEAALMRRPTERTPCFPLIDLVFAAKHIDRSIRDVERDPALHAEALCSCVETFPVDGIYINICLSQKQAAGSEGNGTCRIDGALELNMPEHDAMSIARSDIMSLDDDRIESAEIFHPGMLETFNRQASSMIWNPIRKRRPIFPRSNRRSLSTSQHCWRSTRQVGGVGGEEIGFRCLVSGKERITRENRPLDNE